MIRKLLEGCENGAMKINFIKTFYVDCGGETEALMWKLRKVSLEDVKK